MVNGRTTSLLLAAGLCVFSGRARAAEPTSAANVQPNDLASAEQRSTRNTAYSLPAGMWGVGVGALGIGGGDIFAQLNLSRGFGAGIQVEANLAHAGVGLLNIGGRWHFIDTRYFDLGLSIGFWYGHGDWLWIAQGVAKDLIAKVDIISVPVALNASVPLARVFEFDLGLGYTYSQAFGSIDRRANLFQDAKIGARQLVVRPGARWFATDSTSLELSADLPAYTAVPVSIEGPQGEQERDFDKVPFSEVWSLEMALRSRFQPGFFGNLRLHYGEVARAVYGAVFYPSFEVEFRF